MFASSSLEEVYHYVYYQLTSVALTMLDDVNELSINFFSNEFIQAIVNFFTLFAWGLGLTGAAIAIMDFAVSYQTGGGGSFTGTGMNMLRLLVALLTFSSIPILLFQTSMDIYGTVRSVVVGSMDGATVSITDLVKGAVQSMFKSVYGTLPPVKIANGIWEFLKKLTDGFQATDPADAALSSNADWWALIQLIILVWAIFKIFFSNLKRGGILLVQICVGSMHMLALARGYTDGFGSWCKQVAALCFTAFVQNLLYLLAIIMMQDLIYQDKQGNIVFVCYDCFGRVKSAHKRGTNSAQRYRGFVTGGEFNCGFSYANDNATVLYVFEAPIDLMSFLTLHRHEPWHRASYLSLGGLSEDPLRRFLKEHKSIQRIAFCFDNDINKPENRGQEAAKRFMRQFSGKYITSILCPCKKDWNDVLRDKIQKGEFL